MRRQFVLAQGVLVISLATLLALRHILVLLRPLDFIVSQVTIDDTYYYLSTAWNQFRVGFTTFDGYNPTNGVQFLWYWLLAGYSLFFPSREAFLLGTLALCAALSSAAVVAAWRLGRALELGWASVVLATAVALMGTNQSLLLMGLENTLHLLLLLLVITLYVRFLQQLNQAQPATLVLRFVVLSIGLALLTWTRIDNAPLSALLFSHAALEYWQAGSRPWRGILSGGSVAAAAAAIQLAGNELMGGSFTPVSGLWKQVRTLELTALTGVERWELFGTVWTQAFKTVFPLQAEIGAESMRTLAFALPIALLVLIWIQYCFRQRLNGQLNRPALRGLAVLVVGVVFHQALMVVRLPHEVLRATWYQGPQLVLIAMALALLMEWIPSAALSASPSRYRFTRGVTVGLALLYIIAAVPNQITSFEAWLTQPPEQYRNYHAYRLDMARWIDKNLPPDVRIGSSNAGELNFFSGRPVTNLDGLINSAAYFEYRQQSGTIRDWSEQQGIQYFVDYRIPPYFHEDVELIYSVPLPQDDPQPKPPLQVLRLLPTGGE